MKKSFLSNLFRRINYKYMTIFIISFVLGRSLYVHSGFLGFLLIFITSFIMIYGVVSFIQRLEKIKPIFIMIFSIIITIFIISIIVNSNIINLYTGKNTTEYLNVPEFAPIRDKKQYEELLSIGFSDESLQEMAFASILTHNIDEKAQIYFSYALADKVAVFQDFHLDNDKFYNIIVILKGMNGRKYYINKPGMSVADLESFIADIVMGLLIFFILFGLYQLIKRAQLYNKPKKIITIYAVISFVIFSIGYFSTFSLAYFTFSIKDCFWNVIIYFAIFLLLIVLRTLILFIYKMINLLIKNKQIEKE